MDTEYGALFRVEEVKAGDGGWLVEGYVSTFGNTDHGGDVVMRGAFDASLASNRPVRFLYQHKTDQILGVAKSLKADDRGLFGSFEIIDTALGTDVHKLLKKGALDSFSIGFIPTEVEFDDVGIRLLKQIDLMEASLVSFAMNDRAVVTRVKADLPFDQLLQRAVEHLKLGVSEAEALHARRAADGRELNERHLAAIQGLHPEAKALVERLTALLTAPTSAQEVSGDWKLRLELARRRLTRLGIDLEAA